MPSKSAVNWITFLNALAFGIICPLLFFVFVLTDGTWMAIYIGIVIGIDSAGRIVGRHILPRHRSMVWPQAIMLISFALLTMPGPLKLSHAAAILLLYISRFLGAMGASDSRPFAF